MIIIIKEYKLKYKPSDITICVRNKNLFLHEKSLVAIKKDTNQVMAVGNEVENAISNGEIPDSVVTMSPLRYGFVAEYSIAYHMFKYFMQKAYGRKFFAKPKVVVSIPPEPTEVEMRAYSDLMLQCGARDVLFSEESVAILNENLPSEYKIIVGISYSS